MRRLLNVGLLLVVLHTEIATAAEVRVLSVTATGLMALLEQLAPEFERTTGHRIVTAFDLTPDLQRRVQANEPFDVIVLVPSVIDDLTRQGKLVAGVRIDFARTGVGVCVRRGAPKPNISSVEAFRRALVEARSISYNPAVASGREVAVVLERLGIAEVMKTKTVSAEDKPGPGRVTGMVARGEADLGLVITTDILADANVEYVGPLPPELQSYTTFTAALLERAKGSNAAKALIEFLRTPSARSAIRARGMEVP